MVWTHCDDEIGIISESDAKCRPTGKKPGRYLKEQWADGVKSVQQKHSRSRKRKLIENRKYWSFDKEARGPIEKIGETRIIGNSFYRE